MTFSQVHWYPPKVSVQFLPEGQLTLVFEHSFISVKEGTPTVTVVNENSRLKEFRAKQSLSELMSWKSIMSDVLSFIACIVTCLKLK